MNAKYLPVLALLIGLAGCHPSYLKPAKGWNVLFPSHSDTPALGWKLVETYDPYNGGQLSKIADGKILTFSQTGAVTQTEQPAAPVTGNWYINPAKNGMFMAFPPEKTQPTEGRFPYQFALRHDTLVLSQQGRHGWVEQRYVAVKQP
jgi:hypothetical protein